MTVEMNLSHQELTTAAFVGVRRQIHGMATGRVHWGVLQSRETHAFDNHIVGAMAELAVAKHFNLFWDDSVGRVDKRDIGGILEVRCRRMNVVKPGFDLAIRPKDSDKDDPFLLIHERMPRFSLVGWIYGSEADDLGVFNKKTGLRYVVPAKLRSMVDLIDLVNTRRVITVHAEVSPSDGCL